MPRLQELMAVEPAAPINHKAWRHTRLGVEETLHWTLVKLRLKTIKNVILLVLRFLPQVSIFCSSFWNLRS